MNPYKSRSCLKCGVTFDTRICKACASTRGKEYRALNPEKVKKDMASWRAKNAEKETSYRAEYYAKNSARMNLATRSWKLSNVEKNKRTKAAYHMANKSQENARSRKYHASNKGIIRKRKMAFYCANSSKLRARRVAWYAAHSSECKARTAAWRVANPLAVRINLQNRSARMRANGGSLSRGLAGKLFKLQRGKCACCGMPLGNKYHLDHVMPIALGGPNIDSNIQLLRQRCNSQKGAKHPFEFMQSRGFLL